MSLQIRSGGPYPSKAAGLGGEPTTVPDIPVCGVFICLYLCFAATNMTIFQRNRRRGKKFVLSGVLFGFCMARTTTLVLRIAWATRPTDVKIAIAAQIFVNAGVLIIYIINFICAQRILRARQPTIGWNPVLRTGSKILYGSIGGALIMVITAVVLSLYTLSPHTRTQCLDAELAALTYLLTFTCLPVVQIAIALLPPRSKDEETFGEGSARGQVIIITLSSGLCMLIAGFKAGAMWSPQRPITYPAWYDSKACFFVFNFTLEIIILFLLTLTRFDKRFWIPNGSNQPGDYTRLREQIPFGSEMEPAHFGPGIAKEANYFPRV
ncbi:uncharacterized protein PFLUO_LOCUS2263 [Penicillium psychrofluorescens]|uniref:uncharacterized protein n=1 Tax=Penicillium psychrofluorescens TaxID=3158075 RepID=UPI003CCD47ED